MVNQKKVLMKIFCDDESLQEVRKNSFVKEKSVSKKKNFENQTLSLAEIGAEWSIVLMKLMQMNTSNQN
jgi:hypothetical protein